MSRVLRTRWLTRDYERLPEHSEAFVKWAMIGLMTHRLAPVSRGQMTMITKWTPPLVRGA